MVPQFRIDPARYLGLVGERYAIFSDGIVDLRLGKLAWPGNYGYVSYPAPPDHIVTLDFERPGIRIWSLASGRELARFAGELLPPVAQANIARLKQGQDVIAVDTLHAKQVPVPAQAPIETNQRQRPALPDGARALLEQLESGHLGSFRDISSDGAHLLTGFVPERVCHWSLRDARRDHCVLGDLDPVHLVDPGHAILFREQQQGTWDLATGDVVWQPVPANRPVVPRTLPTLPCGLALDGAKDPGFGDSLFRASGLLATFYDLSKDEWAVVLKDGRYTGSAGASSQLAFFTARGTLLEPRDVKALRDDSAVQSTLRAALACQDFD